MLRPNFCTSCGTEIEWPYSVCDECANRWMAEKIETSRKRWRTVTPIVSGDKASVLALTRLDKEFLKELAISCD